MRVLVLLQAAHRAEALAAVDAEVLLLLLRLTGAAVGGGLLLKLLLLLLLMLQLLLLMLQLLLLVLLGSHVRLEHPERRHWRCEQLLLLERCCNRRRQRW